MRLQTRRRAALTLVLTIVGLVGLAFAISSLSGPVGVNTISTETSTPASGTTYYLSTTGKDDNPGTEAQPFKTFAHAVTVLKPGDTMLVAPGTYRESLADIVPSGRDWSAPVTLKALDPSQRPILLPPPGPYPQGNYVLFFTNERDAAHHIIIDGFVLDGQNIAWDVVKIENGAHHIRLINSELKNAPEQGLLITGEDSQYNEFSHLDIHDVGTTDFHHGVYISTSNNLFENSTVHDNAGWGIQVYNEHEWPCDNNTIRGNDVYNNARIGGRGAGIGLYSGSGHRAYNNVVWNNNEGIVTDYKATSTLIFNNTLYKNDRNGGQYNLLIGAQAFYAEVTNNIIAGHPNVGLFNTASVITTARNNLFFGNGQAVVDSLGTLSTTGSLSGDPLFINPANGDFRIQAGGSGIDMGLEIPDMSDKNGTGVQNSRRDIGAYEFPS